jgi:hypothetical protein
MSTENVSNEEKGNVVLADVSGSLPMWTEIHIQPLDVNDIENSKVYWIKHPQLKQSVYDKNLIQALKDFMELWADRQ